jgi:hypothetical protein
MLGLIKAFVWKLSEQNVSPFEVNNVRGNKEILIGGQCATLSESYIRDKESISIFCKALSTKLYDFISVVLDMMLGSMTVHLHI